MNTRSNVRYTVAIRQAPHPLQSFCVVTTQIRQLLACEIVLLVLCIASRASTFKITISCVLARDTSFILSSPKANVKTYEINRLCYVSILKHFEASGKHVNYQYKDDRKADHCTICPRLVSKWQTQIHTVHTIENIWQCHQDRQSRQHLHALI